MCYIRSHTVSSCLSFCGVSSDQRVRYCMSVPFTTKFCLNSSPKGTDRRWWWLLPNSFIQWLARGIVCFLIKYLISSYWSFQIQFDDTDFLLNPIDLTLESLLNSVKSLYLPTTQNNNSFAVFHKTPIRVSEHSTKISNSMITEN